MVSRLSSRFALAAAAAALLFGAAPAALAQGTDAPQYVIEDNDFLGPGGSDIQSTLPLLANPHVRVLGFTVVVGDAWENEESAHLRRFLEIAHRGDIPVVDGATQPLVNTVELMRLRQAQYGAIPWKGAWGGPGPMDNVPDSQPAVGTLPEGNPSLKATPGAAAMFMIQQVHAHPHQVTIFAAGPLTNVALAIRLDPTFASTAKKLVFMGGLLDANLKTVTGNPDWNSDFNLIFDPEAIHIALTADFPEIVSVGNIANDVEMSHAYMDRIAAKSTPVTQYLKRFYKPLPLWDELTAAIAVDPTLIEKSVTTYEDVEIARGINYGHAYVWPQSTVPAKMGVRKVQVVQSVDAKRFMDNLVHQAQTVMDGH
ncbi:nucleoside hydrolase [Tanticharoenia sakaeratensis]|uniref:Pyrimidine-specific ribonucleoside hydrolase n=1 Tax=Tanticharoenia sakaeratensis NBRC 103193 TaxID=1231623 RepID=A0A0D6MPH9_9PROT|nr:nucleoside hydrolase [Tanticharoenia sakaeratensis]GAN55607.1 pyrimidine-specific ribonucleoside hydrolase [Tanticharoenia sakaeratensis NBRC 103193]